MTTKDLANALPEIITKQVPGPKHFLTEEMQQFHRHYVARHIQYVLSRA